MENLTLAAEDPFSSVELSPNKTTPNNGSTEHSSPIMTSLMYWFMITEIIKFFLCLVNVSANIFLMHVILRFKKLRTRHNYYLFHFALSNTIIYITEPLIFIIVELVFGGRVTMFCLVFKLEQTAIFLTFMFAFGLALDWYVHSYHAHLTRTPIFGKLYQYFVLVLYGLGVVKYLIHFGMCFTELEHIGDYFLLFSYAIVAVLLLLLNFLTAKKGAFGSPDIPKTKYCLIVSNLIVFSWSLLFVLHEVYAISSKSAPWLYAFRTLSFIFEYIVHGNTILVLYVLGRLNKHFKMAYDVSFGKSKNYRRDDLDGDSENEQQNGDVPGGNLGRNNVLAGF